MAGPDVTAAPIPGATSPRQIITASPTSEWIGLFGFCRQQLGVDFARVEPLLRRTDDPLYARLLEDEIDRQWEVKLLDLHRVGRIELPGIRDGMHTLLPWPITQCKRFDPDAETIELFDGSVYVAVDVRAVVAIAPQNVALPPATAGQPVALAQSPDNSKDGASFVVLVVEYLNSHLTQRTREPDLRCMAQDKFGVILDRVWKEIYRGLDATKKRERGRPRKDE